MVALAKQQLQKYPEVRAILLECTEMPPYADALRAATKLPVFDAITCCDFFINGFKDNERFGIQGWQKKWDGKQDKYEFGANLTDEQRARLKNQVKVSAVRSGEGV